MIKLYRGDFHEIKNELIAFLDILGFSNIVKTQRPEYIYNILNSVKKSKKYVSSDRSGEILEETKLYFFSDSIVCAIPANEENAFESLASNCMLIQHAMWSFSSPVWLRGAIVKGPLYCDKNVVFGPALIEAYKLEENLAIFPRIIMTIDTDETGIRESSNGNDCAFIVDTEDNLKMIETFWVLGELQGTDTVKKLVSDELRKQTDIHIREKYLWVKEHYNKYISKNADDKL